MRYCKLGFSGGYVPQTALSRLVGAAFLSALLGPGFWPLVRRSQSLTHVLVNLRPKSTVRFAEYFGLTPSDRFETVSD